MVAYPINPLFGGGGGAGPIDSFGQATFVELSVPLAARLAETLGLPGRGRCWPEAWARSVVLVLG